MSAYKSRAYPSLLLFALFSFAINDALAWHSVSANVDDVTQIRDETDELLESGLNPEEVLVIIDIDGTLTKDEEPVQKTRAQEGATETIQALKKSGVNVIIASASSHFESDPKTQLSGIEAKFLKEPDTRGVLGRIDDLDLRNTLEVQNLKGHSEQAITVEQGAKKVNLKYLMEGDVVSVKEEGKVLYDRKAFSAFVKYPPQVYKNIKKIIVIDDRPSNFRKIEKDIRDFKLYPNLDSINFFRIKNKADQSSLTFCPPTQPLKEIQNKIENARYVVETVTDRPEEVTFDKESAECRNWVDAHKKFCGSDEYDVAKRLLKGVKFVDEVTFKNQMNKLISGFKDKVGEKKFVVVTESGKSSEWLFKQFKDQLNGKNFEVVDEKSLEGYMRDNKDVLDVLKMDDGIYTGSQMVDYAKNIKNALTASGNKGRMHVLAPYSTVYGRDNILSQGNEILKINIEPGFSNIPSVEDSFSTEGSKKTLRSMYPTAGSPKIKDDDKRWAGLTNLFFQHKVPNGWSAISDVFRDGLVRCQDGRVLTGKVTRMPIHFSCIPYVKPPYKRVKFQGYAKDERFNDYINFEAKCVRYLHWQDTDTQKECRAHAKDKVQFVHSLVNNPKKIHSGHSSRSQKQRRNIAPKRFALPARLVR